LLPGLSRVLVLAYFADPITAPQIRELERAATTLGLTLRVRDIRTVDDLPSAFADARQNQAQAALIASASIFFANRAQITELAAKHRLPAAYPFLIQAREGGLMSYSPNFDDMYRRAAEQVDRILKGARPADLPIEQPTKFELVINLKTARALGLTVPPSLLARADEVIE
jgi:putative ABC transport system substrate-binding protein